MAHCESSVANPSTPTESKTKYVKGSSVMEPWRIKNKGLTINRDGKQWHWCTKGHKFNGESSDMYVTHKEGDHDFWIKYNKSKGAEKKGMMAEFREKSKAKHESNGVPVKQEDGPVKKKQRMVLNEKIRQAFCAQAGMTKSQIDNILESCDPK